MESRLRIALVAGETSGDALGAALIEALRAPFPQAEFAGVAGPQHEGGGLRRPGTASRSWPSWD